MGRIKTKGGRKMIVCRTYDEARLDAIRILASLDCYVSDLRIIRVDDMYYLDYKENFDYANEEEESEVE